MHVCLGSQHWKEADSSGSEASRHEDDGETRSGQVHFLVGGEV